MQTKKIIALALSVAVMIVSLPACKNIIQPSRTDIARANFSFLEDPVQVKTELDVVNDVVVAYYSTTVDCFQSDASWNGKATVYYNGTYFSQACVSQRDGTHAAKQWRSMWAEADTGTPLDLLRKWLDKVEAGACIYEKVPVTETICGEDVQVYQLRLNDSSVDWNALCDADFDSLFGGEALLGELGDAEVILQIDTQNLYIRQVQIAATGTTFCEATITIESLNKAPQILWEGELFPEAYLSEEWCILGKPSNIPPT